MIGLDTNVVVRYLVQDDREESALFFFEDAATTESRPGYLSLVTIVELYWVLRSAYNVSASRCAEMIEVLLDARELQVGHDPIVRAALLQSANGPHFTDALIAELGRIAGCTRTVTFDRKAARSTEMTLVTRAGFADQPVIKPREELS